MIFSVTLKSILSITLKSLGMSDLVENYIQKDDTAFKQRVCIR